LSWDVAARLLPFVFSVLGSAALYLNF